MWETQGCLCALLKLLCAWMLHVHRDLCRPLKQAAPLCLHCCLLMIWKQTIKRFHAAPGSHWASVNSLHIWERARKGSHQRPTLMPFEMPQLISAAAMNDHRSNRQTVPGRCSVVQTANNMNRVQWPASWKCWIIQVSECDTLSIQLVSLHNVNIFMVPACLCADSINLPSSLTVKPAICQHC